MIQVTVRSRTFSLYGGIKHKELIISTLFEYVLISLLYACSDEMHQLLVPGRSGRMIDVGIDMAGVLIVLICMILSKNMKWKIVCGVLLGVLLVAAFVALLFVPF